MPDIETSFVAQADEALFRPVRAGNAYEETVERLMQSIKLGVVRPGERLPSERDLASRFNVSRVTLREAIQSLYEAGYVESRRGRYGGTFVNAKLPRAEHASPKPGVTLAHELRDALTLRAVLDIGATELAARRDLSEHERDHLRDRLAESSAARLTDYRRMDSRLHLAIAEVTATPSLTSALADVRMRINDMLDAIPLLKPNIEHSNQQHARILTAILDGDPDAARTAMAEHVAGTEALLHGFLG